MPIERCKVCGDEADWEEQRIEPRRGCLVTFNGTCPKCIAVLGRAFEKVTELLAQGNEEQRERALAALLERLNQNGFETQPPAPASRSLWFDPSIIRELR